MSDAGAEVPRPAVPARSEPPAQPEAPRDTGVPEQQTVIHRFFLVNGGEPVYAQLLLLWRRLGDIMGLRHAVPGVDLPRFLPGTLHELLAGTPDDEPAALAAVQVGTGHEQAVVYRNHDVLSLSLLPAPGSWERAEAEWLTVAGPEPLPAFGEVRLRLALSGRIPPPGYEPSVHPDGLSVLEAHAQDSGRRVRTLIVHARPEDDPLLSRWAWSRGDAGMPLLARHLIQAAKVRHLVREWRRIRVEWGDDPERLALELREDRHTLEIAAENMRRLIPAGALEAGPLAADLELAASLAERFTDELVYLAADTDRAALAAGRRPAARPPEPAPWPSTGRDPRAVFVAHGRDLSARKVVVDYLRALDLRPLEWESMVQDTGRAMPLVRDAIHVGLRRAQAVIVVFTPEDEVRVHRDLRLPAEGDAVEMQARPNVLVELGMAISEHPDSTLIMEFGRLRPLTDLAGLNVIRVSESPDWPLKTAHRLRNAGCPVDLSGQDWMNPGQIAEIAAMRRRAEEPPAGR
ncbi:nucleotide-binding protein [Streptomyces sp. NBC_00433]